MPNKMNMRVVLAVSMGLIVLVLMACGSGSPGSGFSDCGVQGAPNTQQQIGPFATQTTAKDRWREAQDSGCQVSKEVFPCYDASGTRGYCFNIFF